MKWIRKFRDLVETGEISRFESTHVDDEIFLELPDGTWLNFWTSEWGGVKIVPASEVPSDGL